MTAPGLRFKIEISDAELKRISDEFEEAAPEEVLCWAMKVFGRDVALATGFGAEGCVLVSMAAVVNPNVRIFYLDTDLLFPETYALKDQLADKYGVHFERRSARFSLSQQAEHYGDRLWETNPDECCRMRKVEPLRHVLAGLQAWMTGLRRDQSPTRAGVGIVERDQKFGLIKINPLARWSLADVWNYILKNDVPYNLLHNQGYPSIGCLPCTTPIGIGEDLRAGRWRGRGKTECGLHQK